MKLLEIYLVTLNVCALNKWKCGSIVKTVLLSQKMNSQAMLDLSEKKCAKFSINNKSAIS